MLMPPRSRVLRRLTPEPDGQLILVYLVVTAFNIFTVYMLLLWLFTRWPSLPLSWTSLALLIPAIVTMAFAYKWREPVTNQLLAHFQEQTGPPEAPTAPTTKENLRNFAILTSFGLLGGGLIFVSIQFVGEPNIRTLRGIGAFVLVAFETLMSGASWWFTLAFGEVAFRMWRSRRQPPPRGAP